MSCLADDTPMPYGKYRGVPMKDVPKDYLLYMYEAGRCNNALRNYIYWKYVKGNK